MSNLIVKIEQVNEDEHYLFTNEYIESAYENPEELYKACLNEYGKFLENVFIDFPNIDGQTRPKAVGWCFERFEKYDDSDEKFRCVTWVSVLEDWPVMQPMLEKYKEI